MEKRISIVIPLFNSEETIAATVNSVLKQSYKPQELILVDDGSTDNTFRLCKKLCHQLSQVSYIYQTNKGVGAARNRGIKEAAGTHIAFCDHDDLWHFEKLERQIKLFDSDQIGLVYSGLNWKFHDGREKEEKPQTTIFLEGRCFEQLLIENVIPSMSVIVPRIVFERIGMFPESRLMSGSDDRNMWLRIAHDYEIRAVKKPLVTHVITGRNWSLKETKMMHASLACLNDVSQRFEFSTPQRRLALRKAYAETYAHYGRNFFHLKDYKSSRSCLFRALSKGRRNGDIWIMIAATFFLPTFIEKIKSLQKNSISLFSSN